MDPAAPEDRTRTVVFVGSLCCGRQWLEAALGPENISAVVAFDDAHRQPNAVERLNPASQSLADANAFLRSAKFSLQPKGDTNERLSIYQSLAVGTPPLLTAYTVPPLRFPDWRGLAFSRLGMRDFDPREAKKMEKQTDYLDALATYDAFLATFAEKRHALLWSTPAFRDRLGLILADIFPTTAAAREEDLRIAESREAVV